MATVLKKYLGRKQALQQQLDKGLTADDLWRYGELAYRISVLETCQSYCKSAPVSAGTQLMVQHYQMLDAYIQNLALERAYGPNRGPDTEKERDAARVNLSRVIGDYRKRFSSFTPSYDSAYSEEIGKLMGVFMPVWLQTRETFVPLREEKEDTH